MKKQEYKTRRDALLRSLGDNSATIIFSAKEYVRSGDVNYPYRQNSDFYYLTGFVEPDAIAVLLPGRSQGQFVLFNREFDSTKKLWEGQCIGQQRACSDFGVDQSFAINQIDEVLPELLKGRNSIYSNVRFDDDCGQKIKFWTDEAADNVKSQCKFNDLSKILHQMRLKKSKFELQLIRKAIEATAKGHLRAMERCRPGMYEFELEAELLYEFKRHYGCHEAFESIVASGENSCILHYSKNDKILSDGDLVVLDAGAEYKYYCADITRTFPVNGKFTPKQKAIYEVVLAAQTEIINQIRPGVSWDHLQFTAEHKVTEGLIELGILSGKAEDSHAKQEFKKFFMHKFGHWLGLDAHDVGGYCVDDKWRVLEPGMVLTVEPGIYISSENADIVDDAWCGIGVRIEDDILVTEDKNEVLTEIIPKKTHEIEKIMNRSLNNGY